MAEIKEEIILKPCPFCGKTPKLYYGSLSGDSYSEGDEHWQIICNDCNLTMEADDCFDKEEYKFDLINKWNNRK